MKFCNGVFLSVLLLFLSCKKETIEVIDTTPNITTPFIGSYIGNSTTQNPHFPDENRSGIVVKIRKTEPPFVILDVSGNGLNYSISGEVLNDTEIKITKFGINKANGIARLITQDSLAYRIEFSDASITHFFFEGKRQ